MTDAEKQPAVDLVRVSDIVEQINGGQSWEIEEVAGSIWHERVTIGVEWDKPVESGGPWMISGFSWLRRGCNNVRTRFAVHWSNVRSLTIRIEMESMQIVRVQPGLFRPPPPDKMDDQPVIGRMNWLGPVDIYNEKTDRNVYKGPAIFSMFVPGSCPRGYRD